MGYIRIEFGSSGAGNALDQVFLLGDRLGTNRKGIERAKAKGIADRFILSLAQVPLSENLHPDDSLPRRPHLSYHAYNRRRIGIHVRSDRVDPHQVHLDPL